MRTLSASGYGVRGGGWLAGGVEDADWSAAPQGTGKGVRRRDREGCVRPAGRAPAVSRQITVRRAEEGNSGHQGDAGRSVGSGE